MKTKDQIMKDSAENQLWDTLECANSFQYAILEALLDIRDLLHKQIVGNTVKEQQTDLEEMLEPIITDAQID